MPRTQIAPVVLLGEAPVAYTTTVIDAALVTNGIAIPAAGEHQRLVIRITNASVAEKIVTIKSSPADNLYPKGAGHTFLAGRGDLVVAVPASGDTIVTGLESARFGQRDDAALVNVGALLIDLVAGHTGVISVHKLPKSAI